RAEQNHPADAVGRHEAGLDRDAPAQTVADDVRPVDTDGVEEGGVPTSEVASAVAPPRCGGVPEPGQVRRDDAVVLCEPEDEGQQGRGRRTEAVQTHDGRCVRRTRLDIGRAYAERRDGARAWLVVRTLNGEGPVELQAEAQV